MNLDELKRLCSETTRGAELLAAARNALPALIERMEKLEAVVDAAKAESKIIRENPSGYQLTILEDALAALDKETEK